MRVVIEIKIDDIDKLTEDNIDKVINEIHEFLANNHKVGYLLVDEKDEWFFTTSEDDALRSRVAFNMQYQLLKAAIRTKVEKLL